jgi:endonuclease YncB( thermonuclease family)
MLVALYLIEKSNSGGATMADFLVTNIIDGDTFEVNPAWQWNGQTGTRVRPTGYDAKELGTYGERKAKEKLASLIFGKSVELVKAYRVDRGRLVCDVYYNGRYLADYFPEYS